MPRRVLHDEYFKQAKAQGYASRAAYKLIQINEKFSLIHKGHSVLDLGCAPGSWLQIAAELVGPSGRVAGIDLQPVRISLPAHVSHMEGDIYETQPAALTEPLGGRADAVISDMGPSTDGHADHYRSIHLCDRALALCLEVLKPGGACVMKVLEGAEYPRLLQDCGELFTQVKGYKPKASRSVSREMYAVCRGFVGLPATR